MSLGRQILVILSLYFLSFLYERSFFDGIKSYQLNNSAYKKRKKRETFIEWLLCSRYKKEIPKVILGFYYFILIIHPVCVIVCVVTYFAPLSFDLGEALACLAFLFDPAWILITRLLFWTPTQDYAYERWIQKRRGQKPKK